MSCRFLASIGTAFTGYLVQTNFDSQWISSEAKDGLNSVGIGAWFNVVNVGQMLLWHVVLLPLVVGVIVVWHVLLVRTARCRAPDWTRTRRPRHDHTTDATGRPSDRTATAQVAADEFAARPWSGCRARVRPGQGVRGRARRGRCAGASGSRPSSARPTRRASPCRRGRRPTPNDFVADRSIRAGRHQCQ